MLQQKVNGSDAEDDSDASAAGAGAEAMDHLKRFSEWYADFHGYISLIVCIIGVLCNLFNIAVLTRKELINTTSYLLTALAVADLLTMLSYIPYALHFHVLYGTPSSPDRNCYPWIVFLWFHVNFSLTTHTASIWFGVLISAFRYSYIRTTTDTASVAMVRLQMRRVSWALAIVCTLTVVVLLPNYVSLRIVEELHPDDNRTMYEVTSVNSSEWILDEVMTQLNFWTHALVIKIIPCGLMSIFGFLLIQTMTVSHRRGKELKGASAGQKSRRAKRHQRTTAMLVTIILLFLATELPQGVLALLSGLDSEFFERYYVPLGDIMDIVALVNNGINFALYCSMSKRFRLTFLALFCPCFCKKLPNP